VKGGRFDGPHARSDEPLSCAFEVMLSHRGGGKMLSSDVMANIRLIPVSDSVCLGRDGTYQFK
jgi:hypothetical protein